MNITGFVLKNKVTSFFVIFLIITGGILSYFKLGKLEDPEFTIKTAVVATVYPGASSYEVEQEVTRKIEEAVQSADMVEKIRSKSRAGLSMVYVDLYESVRAHEIQQLWDILRRKVDAVQKDLPKGAIKSMVFDDYSDVFGIFLAITGDGIEQNQLKRYAKYIKKELLLVKDVDKIKLTGLPYETIYVEIDPAKASSLGIHPFSIIEAVKDQNNIAVPGSIETSSKRIRIDQPDTFGSLDEIRNLIIHTKGGVEFFLKDIAEIKRTYSVPPEPFMRFNGKDAIGIAISAKSDANVVHMGDAVAKKIDELLKTLPAGVEIHGIYYQSEFVKDAIKKFMTNLIESIAIVVMVLLVSMGLRAGFIIASNLILSIFATFIIMLIIGINLQQISIAALILVMGMIVDNAIVVAEGAQTDIFAGKDKYLSVFESASKTSYPLLGATIIASLAFMPIYLAPNNMGEFVGSLFVVVAVSLGASWILAMTQTPLFSIYLLKKRKSTKENYSGFIYRIYKGVLNFCLKYRIITIVIMTIFLFAGVKGFVHVKKNFFADSEKAQFYVDYRRAEGSKIESVSQDIKKFENFLSQKKEVVNYTSSIGEGVPRFAASITPRSRNSSFAQVVVNVDDFKKIDECIKDIKKWFKQNLPQGEPHLWKYISGPNGKYRIEARFTGRDPFVLRELAAKAKKIMEKNKFTGCVADDWREKVMIFDMDYSQLRGRKAGIERSHMAAALLAATDGIPVSNFREADELIPVKFKYSNITPENIESLPVWGNTRTGVPLSQIADKMAVSWEDPVVRRYNRTRVIRAQCDPVSGVTANTLLEQIRPEIEKIKLPIGYALEWGGEAEKSANANKGVQKYLPVCLLLMVLILVLLFNSVKQPLIIILTLPFAVVGISAGLLFMDQPFGFLPILGAYSLMGMLIKNAVVLIDEINIEIKGGVQPDLAVKKASVNRMRPVLLTSFTTIFGMTPLLKDALFVSMAVTIMFGLLFATILTLVLVPVLYSIFYNIKYK